MPQATLWSVPGLWPVVHPTLPLPPPGFPWHQFICLKKLSPERETTCQTSHSKLVTEWSGKAVLEEMVTNSHMTPASEMQPLLLLSPQTTQLQELQ